MDASFLLTMTTPSQYARLAVVLAIGLMSIVPAEARAEQCYEDWDKARPLIKQHGLLSGAQIIELARAKGPQGFLKAVLCDDGGRFVYKLYFLEGTDNVKTLQVDAKEPAFPG
jgi:uncharacterized membrane protein YkoI